MRVYEMIFSQGLEEKETALYLVNNIKTREDFIHKMQHKINLELSYYKNLKEHIYLAELFDDIYNESHYYLEKMKCNFIEKGIAQIDSFIFLEIKERNIVIL